MASIGSGAMPSADVLAIVMLQVLERSARGYLRRLLILGRDSIMICESFVISARFQWYNTLPTVTCNSHSVVLVIGGKLSKETVSVFSVRSTISHDNLKNPPKSTVKFRPAVSPQRP